MTIGTLLLWTFGNGICSRDFHYLFHTVSAFEKDKAFEFLWRQHCNEMQLIEGNVIIINEVTCTFQFYPAADTAWLYVLHIMNHAVVQHILLPLYSS